MGLFYTGPCGESAPRPMVNILLNGEPQQVDPQSTLADALCALGYELPAIAVALNGQFIPKSRYAETRLADGHSLEVVSPMQGG
jgi:sulfur carrier protein